MVSDNFKMLGSLKEYSGVNLTQYAMSSKFVLGIHDGNLLKHGQFNSTLF